MKRLSQLVAACALVVGMTALPACAKDSAPKPSASAAFVTSGDCPREQRVVSRALARTHVRADVNGDGRPDRVAVAADPGAPRPCRAFVGVRLAGGKSYSTHLIAEAVPVKGLRPRIVGLPRLGGRTAAEIVVDTAAAVDAELAQLFAFGGGRLYAIDVPGTGIHGSFIVTGGGLMFPQGAACTSDGRMVLTSAAQSRDGTTFRVTRRTYQVRGRPLRLVDPVITRATVPVDQVGAEYPELSTSHWSACSAGTGA